MLSLWKVECSAFGQWKLAILAGYIHKIYSLYHACTTLFRFIAECTSVSSSQARLDQIWTVFFYYFFVFHFLWAAEQMRHQYEGVTKGVVNNQMTEGRLN